MTFWDRSSFCVIIYNYKQIVKKNAIFYLFLSFGLVFFLALKFVAFFNVGILYVNVEKKVFAKLSRSLFLVGYSKFLGYRYPDFRRLQNT